MNSRKLTHNTDQHDSLISQYQDG